MARPVGIPVNGCFDHPPFADKLTAQDGWLEQGRVRNLVEIDAVNTKECQYSIRTVDAKCTGCIWKHNSGGQDGSN